MTDSFENATSPKSTNSWQIEKLAILGISRYKLPLSPVFSNSDVCTQLCVDVRSQSGGLNKTSHIEGHECLNTRSLTDCLNKTSHTDVRSQIACLYLPHVCISQNETPALKSDIDLTFMSHFKSGRRPISQKVKK